MLELEEYSIHYKYLSSADEHNETIILLHGNGFHSVLWEDLINHLIARFHVVVMDLPGCGRSVLKSGQRLNWPLFCGAIDRVAEALHLTSFHLIGHSFGGSLAITYANHHSERVRSLILISVVIYFPEEEGRKIIDHYVSSIQQHSLVEIVTKHTVPFLTLLPAEDRRVQAIIESYRHTSEKQYIDMFKLQMIERPLNALPLLKCPTLLLAGGLDNMYFPTLQAMTGNFIPGSRFLIVPNAANALFIDQPYITSQWIMDFIHKEAQAEAPVQRTHLFTRKLPVAVRNIVSKADAISKIQSIHTLKVQLFYSFDVRLNGVEIDSSGWHKRYAKNILAYLIFHPNCSREEICNALFSDMDPKTAAANLKVYINYLKKLLMLPDGESSIILSGRKSIRLDAFVQCDLLEYLHQVRELDKLPAGEEKYEKAKAFFAEIRETTFMTSMYDQWFLEYRLYMEDRIASLAQWLAEWERTVKHNALSAAHYMRLVSLLLSDEAYETSSPIQ